MEITREEIRRINVRGMKKAWVKVTAALPNESRKYEAEPNLKNSALMTLHIEPTEDAINEVRRLLTEIFNGISAYYDGQIHRSEFFYTSINTEENNECYPEIYFEDISGKAVHALGKMSDIIIEKYNGSQRFMLEMLKVRQKEAEYTPVYYEHEMDYEENPFNTHAADFCM